MGISRDSTHKRRATGGRQISIRKKRKFELGRPPAMTKIGPTRIHKVRTMGGHHKFRALRLDHGNFSWGTEHCTRKTRILNVVYNASNNELVRTNTLVKNCIVQIDATPFRLWYESYYGLPLGRKKDFSIEDEEKFNLPRSKHVKNKLAKRRRTAVLDPHVQQQFSTGRLYACVSSRPGQCGRCDGYIIEGEELDFYLKKLSKKHHH
ncbi:small ribosomal subunit protein eS8-like [Zophobas morio]